MFANSLNETAMYALNKNTYEYLYKSVILLK